MAANRHMLPNGGHFNEGVNTSALDFMCRVKAAQPGPGQYDQRPRRDEQPRGGRFSLGNPKSDVEWMIYWAERLPGPGEYKIRDTRMIGVDVWGGKFNESRPESDVERKMRIGRCTPGPGEHNVDSGPKMEGGRFNMSNPKTDLDFLLDRAKDMPGPDTYDNPRWPCPAGGRASSKTAAKKLDRYRAEGASTFPKQPVPVRRARSLNDISPFRATVTARQSNYVRPAAPQRAASVARSSTGAAVLRKVSEFIESTKSKMVDVFHLLDKDGSGTLDAWELREALAQMGLKLEPEDVVLAMKEMDDDRDGTIDVAEFLKRLRIESLDQRGRERTRAASPDGAEEDATDAAATVAAVSAAKSAAEVSREGGTPASYNGHLSMSRPPLQPDLHSVDWGAVQPNDTNNQRFLASVERSGEEFALGWDAKTRQLHAATETARMLELADRRDDALQRFTERQ